MRFNVPLFVLMLLSAGIGLVSLGLGLLFVASPFRLPLQIGFEWIFPSGVLVGGGLMAFVVGLASLRWSFNCLKDLFSTPVTIRGQVSGRRLHHANKNVTPKCYVTIGNEEWEVPESDYAKVTDGQEVALTYLPNTRTVETVTPVCPGWLSVTVIAIAQSIAANQDWSALPVLADALEEAGCMDVGMLQRCRESASEEDGSAVVEAILEAIEAAKRGLPR